MTNASNGPDDPRAQLERLLIDRGIPADRVRQALEQLGVLASAVPSAAAVERAIVRGRPGAIATAAASARSWMDRVIASMGDAADAIGRGLAPEAQPVLAGVRRSGDPDRFCIDHRVGCVTLEIDCERLPASQGWRVVGHVASGDAPPSGIEVAAEMAGVPRVIAAIDEFAMFECTLASGTYRFSFVHEAQEVPLLSDLTLP